jgi:hypothetical protein
MQAFLSPVSAIEGTIVEALIPAGAGDIELLLRTS